MNRSRSVAWLSIAVVTHASSHHSAGRGERAVEAELLGGARDLDEVADRGRAWAAGHPRES